MAQFTNTFLSLPQSLQGFLRHLVQEIGPDSIFLFGSRARGTHRENSDFDLAVKLSHPPGPAWTKLLLELEYEPYTLQKVDLLLYDSLNESYRKNIDKEGVVIYG